MGAQIGGVVTASSTAIIASSYGWTVSFLAAAAVCLFGGLLWLLIDPKHALPVAAADRQMDALGQPASVEDA